MEIARFEDCLSDDECKCTTEADCGIKKWYLDRDGDGYHAKGSEPKEQVESPGEDWVEGVSDGEDCDDTKPELNKLNSCEECALERNNTDCDDCDTTKEDLKKAFPNLSDANATKLAQVLNDKGKDFGIDTKEKMRHFLAQASHETGGFNKLTSTESTYYSTASRLVKVWPSRFSQTDTINKKDPDDYTKNSSKLANFVYADRMGNGDIASGDGFKYRGRGIFQLTGKDNYTSFKNAYNAKYEPDKDFVANPGLLASDNEIAILSALWYYQNRVLNKITVNDNTTVKSVTRKVNGGTVGLADRKTQYNNAKTNIDCD